MEIYNQYFQVFEEDTQPLIPPPSDFTCRLGDIDASDLGTEVESHLSYTDLAKNLGFTHNSLPYQFSHLRHKTGATAWEEPQLFIATPETSPCLVPLSLHWHQLAGVHSIIRRAFTVIPLPSHCTGTLECDEVGLGKTALGITVAAFLNQVVVLQQKKEPLPPLLRRPS